MAEIIGPISEVSDFVVRIRGIPWSCSKDEIVDFFNDCNVKNGTEGVHFVHAHDSGKPSGEAFIELETDADVDKAKKHTMGYIGTRYIEVYDSTKDDMVFILNGGKRGEAKGHRKDGRPPRQNFRPQQFPNENFGFMANTCVRLRGLPFNCTEKDLYEFFEGIEIVSHGIKMPLDGKYRSVGEAYVKFATTADVDKAMSKHKEKIGHRYIELFRSNPREFDNCYVPGWTPPPRPPPVDRPLWMNDYGPRGSMNPYPAYDYGPRWNGDGGGGGPSFPPPPPSYQYDYNYNNYYGPPGPPPYEANHWSPYHYSPHPPPGPMRGSGRPPHRPVPYERPPPWATEPIRPQEPHIKSPPFEPPPHQPPPQQQLPPPPPPQVSKPLGNNFVFVRNLPHNVVEKDIDLFFRVKPTSVKIILDPYGRPEEANVAFATHEDAVKAMEQDKQLLFDKQVDLFLCSKEIPSALNGSRQQKEPKEEEEIPASNYNYAYSYKAPPSNGSNGNENGNANPPVSSPSSQPSQPPPSSADSAQTGELSAAEAKTAQNNLSYFGMPPVRWPSSTALRTGSSAAAYPPWSVPYYNQNGQYYGYAAYTYPVSTNPPSTSSIRREPVNYTSR